ncbi:hypothetical protein [Curtobacterium sp. MCBD17_040]|uniref:hypothetical protein n=1 Tax=Curtobacterium sp. MCBD17_040 TaxID=2175674 RepID=UPI000DA752A9|nr:hypothetical protein [Curtobacterium sp. MCBD17_040]WIB65927.1 hypothetical protein DEI94_17580 [Curtobacterium sp. MCBD17_040]
MRLSDYQHRILLAAAEHRLFYATRQFQFGLTDAGTETPETILECVRPHAMRVLLGRGLVYEAPSKEHPFVPVRPTEDGHDILRAEHAEPPRDYSSSRPFSPTHDTAAADADVAVQHG